MSYPTSVKSFTTRAGGDVIQPAHMNDVQDEITAIETDLLSTWTSEAFSAGAFTANGAGTWTVASGDVTTLAYEKIGKVMTVSFLIVTSTVGGTPSTELRITIPGGFTALRSMRNACTVNDNGGGNAAGYCYVVASSTYIAIAKLSGNWSTATNTTECWGQIRFETTT